MQDLQDTETAEVVIARLGAVANLVHPVNHVHSVEAGMIHFWGNIAEGIFWIIIAGVVYVRSRRGNVRLRRLGAVAGVAFVCFGISDFIEVRTGAWYDPIALLVFKAACVLVLLACLILYYRNRGI